MMKTTENTGFAPHPSDDDGNRLSIIAWIAGSFASAVLVVIVVIVNLVVVWP